MPANIDLFAGSAVCANIAIANLFDCGAVVLQSDGDAVENRVAGAFDIVVRNFPDHDASIAVFFDPAAFDGRRVRVFEGDVAGGRYAVGFYGDAVVEIFPVGVLDNIFVGDLLCRTLGEIGAGARGALEFKPE